MTTVMNMSGYEIECDTVVVEEYGDEVMDSGWTPALVEVSVQTDRNVPPATLVNTDIEAFLEKMYRYQS